MKMRYNPPQVNIGLTHFITKFQMKRATDGPKLAIHLEDLPRRPALKYQFYGLRKQVTQNLLSKQPASTNQSENIDQHSLSRYIETPDFSRRIDSEAEITQALATDEQKQNKPAALLNYIRQKFQCLKGNSTIKNELQCVDELLSQIEEKLSIPSSLQLKLSKGGFSPISKLNSHRSATHSGGILYTKVNLCQLVDGEEQLQARKPGLLDLQNVDNIQYYKILYLLGESCDIASIRSRKSSSGCLESSRVRDLNKEIEMLDNMLRLKNQKTSNFSSRKDESLKSTKRFRQNTQAFYAQKTRKSPLQRLRSTLISKSKDRASQQKKMQSSHKSTVKNLWVRPYL